METKTVPDVAIVRCGSYSREDTDRAVNDILESLDFSKKLSPGIKIAVKTNLVHLSKPEAAAITHPALLASLTKYLTAHGASVVIGDSPGGPYSAIHVNSIYMMAGLSEAEKEGASLNRDFSQSHTVFRDAKVLRDFEYTSYLKNADMIINFCKLKTHGMMGMSAGVKNMFGAIPGTVKPEYHYRFPNHRDFADMLIDLNLYFRPVLTLCDAVDGMEGNGPTAGTPRHIGAVLGSYSPYMLDVCCSRLINISEDSVPTIIESKERGLLPDRKIVTDDRLIEELTVKDYKNIARKNEIQFMDGKNGIGGKAVSSFLKKALVSRPSVRKKECIGCGKCMKLCPAKAISIKEKCSVIDRSKCIRCFCCQEFCPVGAIKVKRPVIAKIASKL